MKFFVFAVILLAVFALWLAIPPTSEPRGEVYQRIEVVDLTDPSNRIRVLNKMFHNAEHQIYNLKKRSWSRVQYNQEADSIVNNIRNTQTLILCEIRLVQEEKRWQHDDQGE